MNGYLTSKPNFSGINTSGVTGTGVTNLTWDSVKRLRDVVKGKLLLKGILAHEDAKLATEAGIDGIVVSNHGGRVEDSSPATIDVLPEIVAAAGKMPVLVDSGFRRGADIVKALALGAQAVCIGRPYLWGLGAFGAGCRARAGNPARRDPCRHATARCAHGERSHAGDGAASLTASAGSARIRAA
jgi:(S)-2-hydroxy-acid oxidase